VRDLVRDHEKQPGKLRETKDREKEQAEQREAIKDVVLTMQEKGQALTSKKVVSDAVREETGLVVGAKIVREVLRTDLNLSYLKAKKLNPQVNADRALVLRQQYALEMLKLLNSNKRVINVDETWLNETSHTRRTWAPKDGTGNMVLNPVTPRLAMIAAIDTDGHVWFALSHANTDSNMMALFFWHLAKALDRESPGWQDQTVFLLDNASYHSSAETRAATQALGLKLIFSGPYSYSAAPIELLFGGLKAGELNPENLPTGKK
jgi:hypothetical protein